MLQDSRKASCTQAKRKHAGYGRAVNAKLLEGKGHILIFLIQVPRAGKALQLGHDRLLRQQLIHLEEGINQGLLSVTPLVCISRKKFLSLQHKPLFAKGCKLTVHLQSFEIRAQSGVGDTARVQVL